MKAMVLKCKSYIFFFYRLVGFVKIGCLFLVFFFLYFFFYFFFLDHEGKLLALWQLLRPGVPLSARVSDQWKTLGFQGQNFVL
jgi:hypothetical protein